MGNGGLAESAPQGPARATRLQVLWTERGMAQLEEEGGREVRGGGQLVSATHRNNASDVRGGPFHSALRTAATDPQEHHNLAQPLPHLHPIHKRETALQESYNKFWNCYFVFLFSFQQIFILDS